ncbi:cytochrome P450 [Streptomyces sp. NPDC059740]|uniref:cytochrome P450 n=1 Tax=Streptomyces sp. NPDC059740 TaxID=3346926 RepID=UPI00364A6D42
MTSYTPHRERLYGPEFTSDPHAVYARLRSHGPVAPVEIAPGVDAHLVTGYRAALELLNDTETWSKDSRNFIRTLPVDSPVYVMLEWHPNLFFNDGAVHARYRSVVADSFKLVEPHRLRAMVAETADSLIRDFAVDGEADLVAQFARPLPVLLMNALCGMPEATSEEMVQVFMDTMSAHGKEESERARAALAQIIAGMVESKMSEPGEDLPSWYLQHPAQLTPEEVAWELAVTLVAGQEPTTALISNALSRMLSNPAYYSSLSSGALTARDAINTVLRVEPPVANLSAHYPRHNVRFHGTWIPADSLVLVSFAAANAESDAMLGENRSDGGAHLAWAAGPHACPVKQPALLIATAAIERLTSHLYDLELGVPRHKLEWRPGPFHRALENLPARFTPVQPDRAGLTPWSTASR